MGDDTFDKFSALLEFYSNRAVAHASFLVASIFGILTFLSIVAQRPNLNTLYTVIATVLYIGLSYMGYHCLVNFNHYASLSEAITQALIREKELFEKCGYLSKRNKETGIVETVGYVSVQDYESGNYDRSIFWSFQKDKEKMRANLKKKSLFELLFSDGGNFLYGITYWIALLLLGVFSFSFSMVWQSLFVWLTLVFVTLVFLIVVPYFFSIPISAKIESNRKRFGKKKIK